MTSKKYLSDKKSSQQTISISPALQEWIKRYVNIMQKKYPNDKRYKSVSSFYTTVMESVLTIFEKGKTLDDLEKIPDSEIEGFYDKITFKAIIPLFENAINMNKFSDYDFEKMPMLFLRYWSMIGNNLEVDFKDEIKIIERFKSFLLANKLTRDFRVNIINDKFCIEYSGYYENLHFEMSKTLAGILGLVGFKISNFLYSKEEKYSRFDLTKTDLVHQKDLLIDERKKLFIFNQKFFSNFYQILNANDHHFWMKISENKDILIDFNNDIVRNTLLETIENDLKEFGKKEEYLLNLLKMFRSLHWISIENENILSYRINLPKEKYSKEFQFMNGYLSKYAEINEKDGLSYLIKKF